MVSPTGRFAFYLLLVPLLCWWPFLDSFQRIYADSSKKCHRCLPLWPSSQHWSFDVRQSPSVLERGEFCCICRVHVLAKIWQHGNSGEESVALLLNHLQEVLQNGRLRCSQQSASNFFNQCFHRLNSIMWRWMFWLVALVVVTRLLTITLLHHPTIEGKSRRSRAHCCTLCG